MISKARYIDNSPTALRHYAERIRKTVQWPEAQESAWFWFLVLSGALFLVTALPYLNGRAVWEQPWLSNAPGLLGFSTNPGDMTIGSGYGQRYTPMREFIVHSLRAGTFPLWNPHNGLGNSLALESEYQQFNPLEWMYWFGSSAVHTLVRWLQISVGAFGIFLIAWRRVGTAPLAALCGALVYGLTGYAEWFWLYPSFFVVLVPAPYAVYFIDRVICREKSGADLFFLTLSLALILLVGQPQIAFCLLAIAMAFSLLHLVRSRPLREMAAPTGTLMLSGILAVLIASPHIVPITIDQLSGYSVSGHEFDSTLRSPGRVTSLLNTFNLITPAIQGIPISIWFTNGIIANNSAEDFLPGIGFLGSALIVFGAIGSFLPASRGTGAMGSTGRRLVQNASTAFLFSFIIVLSPTVGGPNLWPFFFANFNRYSVPFLTVLGCIVIPYGAMLAAQRFRPRLLTGSAVFVLVVIGLEVGLVLLHPQTRILGWNKAVQPLLLTLLPALLLILALFGLRHCPSKGHAGLIVVCLGVELAYTTHYGLDLSWDLARWIAYAPVLLAAFTLHRRCARFSTPLGIPLAACGLLAWAGAWTIGGPVTITNPAWSKPAPEVLRFLRSETSPSFRPRYLASYTYPALSPNANTPAGVDSISGKFAIAQATSVSWLWQFVRPEARSDAAAWLGHNCFDRLANNTSDDWRDDPASCAISPVEYVKARAVFAALSVNTLIAQGDTFDRFIRTTQAIVDAGQDWRIVDGTACTSQTNANTPCPVIYRDLRALPRAYFAETYRLVPFTQGGWVARDKMGANPQLLLTSPVVEFVDSRAVSSPSPVAEFGAPHIADVNVVDRPAVAPKAAEIVRYQPNRVAIKVEAAKPGLLVLNDAYAPFWSVNVDGRAAVIHRVNATTRGVFVKAGTHTIEFFYGRIWRRLYRVALGGLVLSLLFAWLRSRTGRKHTARAHPLQPPEGDCRTS